MACGFHAVLGGIVRCQYAWSSGGVFGTGQRHNIAAEHPEVVARMRAHYDAWWRQVDPGLDRFEPVYVGCSQQNSTVLTAGEWGDVWLDQTAQVRRGERKNGTWHVFVQTAGRYEFRLRRWPPTAQLPLCSGAPAHRGEVGAFEKGVALPIARARLLVGQQDVSSHVGSSDVSAVFTLDLPRGPVTIRSWFYDGDGEEICGAYYVVVRRLGK